jgi:hypothetical protein
LLLKEKPDESKNHPDDVAATVEAQLTVGDYRLKSAANYIVPKHLCMSTVKKYDQLLEARKRVILFLKTYLELELFVLQTDNNYFCYFGREIFS